LKESGAANSSASEGLGEPSSKSRSQESRVPPPESEMRGKKNPALNIINDGGPEINTAAGSAETPGAVSKRWEEVLGQASPFHKSLLASCSVRETGDSAELFVSDLFAGEVFRQPDFTEFIGRFYPGGVSISSRAPDAAEDVQKRLDDLIKQGGSLISVEP
jgi:hypothetical protein